MIHFDPPAIIQIVDDDRPTISLSEARTIVEHFVDVISDDVKKHTGEEFSQEKKAEMIDIVIEGLKKQGSYRFVK